MSPKPSAVFNHPISSLPPSRPSPDDVDSLDLCDYTQWQSKDGRTTPIRDMDDTHLRNSVLMVRRRRMTMCQDLVEGQGEDHVSFHDDWTRNSRWISILEHEASRRGLQV